jgi:D-beta-D-heptose 7-phosphate kinase/D-beta-D-heptose 1-phosphate adenosyltransferase
MLKQGAARDILARFAGRHVVVVGDVMLDEYVRGDVARISPEAPVPVVELRERSSHLGGAANTAANVVSLGGRATVLGLVGDDVAAGALRSGFDELRITHSLVVSPGRPTTHKLRVVARTQQIVRVDVESTEPVAEAAARELLDGIERYARTADVLVVSDYAKGVVTETVARACTSAGKRLGIPVVVDPKGRDYTKYAGATVVTPNVAELELATGESTHNADDAIVTAGSKLLGVLDGTAVLVTRGPAGMTLLERGKPPLHFPTVARSVFDVTGAGDTVVGALALALAAGAPIVDGLVIASHAASVAVGKPGTVAVTLDEVRSTFEG